jgi:RND superfamily putative drug exporter
MKLLGDWNWYLPRWLEWLPDVGPGAGTPTRPVEPTEGTAAASEHPEVRA